MQESRGEGLELHISCTADVEHGELRHRDQLFLWRFMAKDGRRGSLRPDEHGMGSDGFW